MVLRWEFELMTAQADRKDNKDKNRMHAKRLGRELAMQYLFQHSFADDAGEKRSWEEFFEQASFEHELKEKPFCAQRAGIRPDAAQRHLHKYH